MAPALRRTARAHRSVQRGQVVVIVALALVTLLGAVGLAVDGGRLYLERRRAQGAADHAAITAAQAYCAGGSTPGAAEAAGVASAALNGFDDASAAIAVSVDGTDTGSHFRFNAQVASTQETAFMRVLGVHTFDVEAGAIAGCTSGAGDGPGAVFAGGTTCGDVSKYTFQVSGSGQQVYGGVHANGDVSIGTKPNDWTDDGEDDPFTYVGTMKSGEPVSPTFYASPPPSGDYNVFEEADPTPGYPLQVEARDWPADYGPGNVEARLDQYEAMAQASGTYFDVKITADDLTGDGVYYSTEEIEIGTVDADLSVTFVSEKTIKLSASGDPSDPWSFTPFVDNLLAFSGATKDDDKKCSEYTVELSGSNVDWNGIIWAPGGLANFPGSSNATLNGTVISWAVAMGGSDLHIAYDQDLFGGPNGPVLLFK